jgi:hypothetical protein
MSSSNDNLDLAKHCWDQAVKIAQPCVQTYLDLEKARGNDLEILGKRPKRAASTTAQEMIKEILRKEDAKKQKRIEAANSVPLGKYRHYKTGGTYEVLGIVLHTETSERMVLYRSIERSSDNPENLQFVRPLSMFTERVKYQGRTVPRFERVIPTPTYSAPEKLPEPYNSFARKSVECCGDYYLSRVPVYRCTRCQKQVSRLDEHIYDGSMGEYYTCHSPGTSGLSSYDFSN